MANKLQVFKCEVCGHMVEVIHDGAGQLVCCNQPMTLQEENTVDAAREKHVPVIEKTVEGILVKVGSVEHPMQDSHFIEWIQLLADGKAYRQFLNPGEKPEAVFKVEGKDLSAREYCNLHGLWKK
jgi:superoxide reductase